MGKAREYFRGLGFVEVHADSYLSILAACEDPRTIVPFEFEGTSWPAAQTAQMWLEQWLLADPSLPGLVTISTSNRNEPNPIPGRHDKRFPMIEFETHGGMEKLAKIDFGLLRALGFPPESFGEGEYDTVCEQLGVKEIDHETEGRIGRELADVFMLRMFPERTHPFWNMKRTADGKHAEKIDVIMYGIETVGSAVRSCDPDAMRRAFLTISGGRYAKLLFDSFGRKRVLDELEAFLLLNFFPRCGGGIGIPRLIRAVELAGLFPNDKTSARKALCGDGVRSPAEAVVAS